MIIAPGKCLLIAGFLAASVQFARGAEMPAVIDRPRAQDGPTQVGSRATSEVR
jgi:hypothetical protein